MEAAGCRSVEIKLNIGCSYRRFELQKGHQQFLRTHNETLSVVAVCVCNPDRFFSLVESDEWTGPAYKTCANAATVAEAFKSSRRRELLEFSHHVVLASLKLKPDLVDELLDWCRAMQSLIIIFFISYFCHICFQNPVKSWN
jgi:hypothetical protein